MSVFHRRQILKDQSGAISIVGALSLMMLLALAAIVIDIGSLYFARRNLQATSDAAALAAVQNPSNASAVAASVFASNGYASPALTVTIGTYTADESLSAENRFVAANSGVNAVQVRATVQKSAYFAPLFSLSNLFSLTTQSTAARVPTASFGAGTRLAELNAGLINSLLGQLWGSNLSLSLVDYQSLLSTNVDALTFFNQLATDIGVTGSYQQLASANVTIGQLLTALAETTATSGAANGNPTGALFALQSLQLQLANGPEMMLSNVIDLSPLSGRTVGDIAPGIGQGLQLNLMSLLSASARNTAAGQTVNIGPSLSIPVANSTVTTRIAIGNTWAQVADAQVGSSIQTSQIRIALTVTLASVNLGVATATVQMPVYLEAAPGQATLSAMPCVLNGTQVEIAGTSGATSAQFGTVTDAALNDFSTSVTPVATPVISVSLLGIPIQANVAGTSSVASSGPQDLTFTQADIDAGTAKSVPDGSATPFAALGSGMTLSTSILANPGLLAAALNAQLDLLTAALNPVIDNLLTQLDGPTNSLITTLGLQLGVLDVSVFGASCRTPTLVG
jgi:uncharacterized membrane protein